MRWLGFRHWPDLFLPPLDETVFGKQSLSSGLPILLGIFVVCDVVVVLLTGGVG